MNDDRELVFGGAARAIEPRAIPEAAIGLEPSASPWDGGRVRVVFRERGVSAAELARLRSVDGALLRPIAEGARGASLLTAPAAALEELASRSEVAAVLFRAHSLATRGTRSAVLVGVVNATPDSFSDGGRHLLPERAAAGALAMVEAGARALDVGGESTRPGSTPTPVEVELERVVPALEAIRAAGITAPISIDTRRSAVAARALEAGATAINDVSAGRDDPEMLDLAAERNCPFIAMHMLGRPREMQRDPSYSDSVAEITAWLRERGSACLQAGIPLHNIVLDPGIGFGKRVQDNVALIRRLPELRSLGRPLLVGPSRKRYLGSLTGEDVPARRVGATAAAVALAVAGGSEYLRVHDIEATRQALLVASAHIGRFPDRSPTHGLEAMDIERNTTP